MYVRAEFALVGPEGPRSAYLFDVGYQATFVINARSMFGNPTVVNRGSNKIRNNFGGRLSGQKRPDFDLECRRQSLENSSARDADPIFDLAQIAVAHVRLLGAFPQRQAFGESRGSNSLTNVGSIGVDDAHRRNIIGNPTDCNREKSEVATSGKACRCRRRLVIDGGYMKAYSVAASGLMALLHSSESWRFILRSGPIAKSSMAARSGCDST